MSTISETGKRYTGLTLEQRSSEEDLLWVPGLADLEKDVSQGVLLVRLKSNIEIDCGFVGRGTQTNPVVRDDFPLVFCNHIVLRCRDSERHCEATKEGGSKGREHRESQMAHNCKKAGGEMALGTRA